MRDGEESTEAASPATDQVVKGSQYGHSNWICGVPDDVLGDSSRVVEIPLAAAPTQAASALRIHHRFDGAFEFGWPADRGEVLLFLVLAVALPLCAVIGLGPPKDLIESGDTFLIGAQWFLFGSGVISLIYAGMILRARFIVRIAHGDESVHFIRIFWPFRFKRSASISEIHLRAHAISSEQSRRIRPTLAAGDDVVLLAMSIPGRVLLLASDRRASADAWLQGLPQPLRGRVFPDGAEITLRRQ